MMDSLQSMYSQILFLLSSLTWLGMIDLLLVTALFYLVLTLVQRSSAAYFLREVLFIGLSLFVLTSLLPLPVFVWLIRAIFIAVLVAIPIIFQAQLRQILARMGRMAGISKVARQSAAEDVLPEIAHAVENMASTRTGGLIVLEGNDPLDEVIQSGVFSGAQVSSELLQSVFYLGTPLHDGAVIIRTDRIVAAGCVLPLTQQSLEAEKRLGTRHRAAVGMSEVSDAMVVVVSEETGHIGISQHGRLDRPVNTAELRDRLQDFYVPAENGTQRGSIIRMLGRGVAQVWYSVMPDSPRQLMSSLGLLFVSLLLTLGVWSFVLEQTDAIELARVEGIPLRVENVPANSTLIPQPPTSVSAIIQTTSELLPTLSSRSFQAVVSFDTRQPGLYRLPVSVNSSVGQVLILSVEPPALDFEVAPIVTRTMPIVVNLLDQDGLSAAYEMVGPPTTTPNEVEIRGPAPLVQQVAQVQTSVSLANANTSLRETRTLRAVNESGLEVSGVSFRPDQARVNVAIRQRFNASDVSVQAAITGTPPSAYQLRNVSVSPSSVTLRGRIEQLSGLGSIVNTRPVDISQVTNNLTVQTPLDLPPNIQALDKEGNPAKTVTVSIEVAPLTGNLIIARQMTLVNVNPLITNTVINPPKVDLLLSGPIPTLDNIEKTPGLVQVLLDLATLRRGQTANLSPEVIAPPEVQVQVVPPSVTVTVE